MNNDQEQKSENQKRAEKTARALADGLNRGVVMGDIARQLAAHLDISLGKAENLGRVFRGALERAVTGQVNKIDEDGNRPVFEECHKKAIETVEAFGDGFSGRSSRSDNQQNGIISAPIVIAVAALIILGSGGAILYHLQQTGSTKEAVQQPQELAAQDDEPELVVNELGVDTTPPPLKDSTPEVKGITTTSLAPDPQTINGTTIPLIVEQEFEAVFGKKPNNEESAWWKERFRKNGWSREVLRVEMVKKQKLLEQTLLVPSVTPTTTPDVVVPSNEETQELEEEEEQRQLSFGYPVSEEIKVVGPPYKGSICRPDQDNPEISVCESVMYEFGERYGATGHIISGLEFGAPPGTPIYASEDGIVVRVKTSPERDFGWSQYVLVSHKDGYSTFYMWLSSIEVSEGQEIKKGDQIGFSGRGMQGPSFYFEIRKNESGGIIQVNPLQYLGDR